MKCILKGGINLSSLKKSPSKTISSYIIHGLIVRAISAQNTNNANDSEYRRQTEFRPIGGRKGWGGGGRKGWGGGAEGLRGEAGRKGWGGGRGEEHEYPVFHLFLSLTRRFKGVDSSFPRRFSMQRLEIFVNQPRFVEGLITLCIG